MIALPKLLLLLIVAVAAWYAMRWFNRAPPQMPAGVPSRAAAQAARRPAIEAEDLVACGVCGTYVALNARGCGKAGCPRPG
jgi:hypothetical protein